MSSILACPKCGADINVRLVATSKQTEVGLVRQRYCQCGGCVTTIERPLGVDLDAMLVEGLDKGDGRGRGPGSDRSMVRQLVKRLGGSVCDLRT